MFLQSLIPFDNGKPTTCMTGDTQAGLKTREPNNIWHGHLVLNRRKRKKYDYQERRPFAHFPVIV